MLLHTLETLFTWLLTASWQASVLALLVLGIQWTLRGQLNPRWRYALWLLVIIRLLLPALPESALSLFQFAPKAPVAFVMPMTEPLLAPLPLITVTPLPAPEPAYPFSLYSLLALIWVTGAFVLIILTWQVNRRFARQIHFSPDITDPELLHLFTAAKIELNVRRTIRLIENSQVQSPAIMGLFHPTLLLPANVRDKFDATELRLIFLHELAHLKRGDVIAQGLIALLQILHWFNPVLWFAFRRMRIDREPATDALVLSRTGEDEKERYGLMLIKLLEHFHQRHSLTTLVGILEDKDQFKRRFSLIAHFTRGAYGWSLLGAILIGVLSVGCLTKTGSSTKAEIQGSVSVIYIETSTPLHALGAVKISQEAAAQLINGPSISNTSIPDFPIKPGTNILKGETPAGFNFVITLHSDALFDDKPKEISVNLEWPHANGGSVSYATNFHESLEPNDWYLITGPWKTRETSNLLIKLTKNSPNQASKTESSPNAIAQKASEVLDPSLPYSLDLKPFYSKVFSDPGGADSSFIGYAGRKIIDGLPFNIDGESLLYGKSNADRNEKYPYKMEGVKIDRKFDELHLIHAVHWREYYGAPVATLRLHYADNTLYDSLIRYDFQVNDWDRLATENDEIIADPDTKIIWRGAGLWNGTGRLFKTVVHNPFPDKQVVSMDVISSGSLASYSLVAATVAQSDSHRDVTPPMPLEPSRHFDGTVKVHVVDEKTGAPITEARVYPGMTIDDQGLVADSILTSAEGIAVVKYPSAQASEVEVEISKPGYVTYNEGQVKGWNRGTIPDEITIKLTPNPETILATAQKDAIEAYFFKALEKDQTLSADSNIKSSTLEADGQMLRDIQDGNVNDLKRVLNHAVDPNTFDPDRFFSYPVYWAVHFNQPQILKLLLDHMASGTGSPTNETPLELAQKIHPDMVPILQEGSRNAHDRLTAEVTGKLHSLHMDLPSFTHVPLDRMVSFLLKATSSAGYLERGMTIGSINLPSTTSFTVQPGQNISMWEALQKITEPNNLKFYIDGSSIILCRPTDEVSVQKQPGTVPAQLPPDPFPIPHPPSTPLEQALAANQIDKVRSLLDQGTVIYYNHYAAALAADKPALVKLLWDHDAKTRYCSELMYAINQRASLPEIEALLEKGGSAEPPEDRMISPLSVATIQGDLPLIKVLVEHGADPNHLAGIWRPLDTAAVQRRSDIIDYLLEHGAKPTAQSLISVMCTRGGDDGKNHVEDYRKIQTRLIEAGALKNLTEADASMLLIVASTNAQDPVMLRQLLDQGLSPEAKTTDPQFHGKSALEAVRQSYDQRATEPWNAGIKPLLEMLEATQNSIESKKAATINPPSNSAIEDKVLLEVIKKGDVASLNHFLFYGGDVKNRPISNPVYLAVYYNRADMLQMLLDHDASTDIDGPNGQSALALAKAQHPDLVPMLKAGIKHNREIHIAALTAKLYAIHLAHLSFENATLETIFQTLTEKAKQADPDDEGVNFVFRRPHATQSGPDPANPLITVTLNNVTLEQALFSILAGTPYKYTAEEHAIYIAAPDTITANSSGGIPSSPASPTPVVPSTTPPVGDRVQLKLVVGEINEDTYTANQKKVDEALETGNLDLFNHLKGVNLYSTPSVTTQFGTEANLDMVREYSYPASFETDKNGETYPANFQKTEVGVKSRLNATQQDDRIRLYVTLTAKYFEGFADSNLKLQTPTFRTVETNLIELVEPTGQLKGIWIPGAHFEERTVTERDYKGKFISSEKQVLMKRLFVFLSATQTK